MPRPTTGKEGMSDSRVMSEGLRVWQRLSAEDRAKITRIAGADLVEATAEDDPPPFALDPVRVRQYVLTLLGTVALDERSIEEEFFKHDDE